MNKKTLTVLTAMTLSGALLTACDADIEEPGSLPDVDVKADAGNLPEYEVNKTKEGNMPSVDVDVKGGKLPEIDVDTAEIELDTKTVEVEVPDIDVKMPDDKE